MRFIFVRRRESGVRRAQENPQLGPGLCISRALGDLDAVRCGLVATPELCQHTVGAGDAFLILATDGVWEFISNEEVRP